MAKDRITASLSEDVGRAVRLYALLHKRDLSELMEEGLRRVIPAQFFEQASSVLGQLTNPEAVATTIKEVAASKQPSRVSTLSTLDKPKRKVGAKDPAFDAKLWEWVERHGIKLQQLADKVNALLPADSKPLAAASVGQWKRDGVAATKRPFLEQLMSEQP